VLTHSICLLTDLGIWLQKREVQ